MDARDLAAALSALPAADVAAVRLYLELQPAADALDLETIEARRDDVERALRDLDKQVTLTQGIVRRCQELAPVPSRQVPDGI